MTRSTEENYTIKRRGDSLVCWFPHRSVFAQRPSGIRESTHGYGMSPSKMGQWYSKDENASDRFLEDLSSGRASKLYLDTYEKMSVKIGREVSRALPDVPSARRRRRRSEEGDEINLDAYIENDPACWNRTKREAGRKRQISIGISVTGHCMRTDEEFARNIAAAVAVVDAFRARGFSMRLNLISFAERSESLRGGRFEGKQPKEFGFAFPILNYGERFNPASLLNWGSSAFTRYLTFAWEDHIFPETNWSGRGYEPKITEDTMRLCEVDFVVRMKDHEDDDELVARIVDLTTGFMKTSGLATA